MKKALKPLGLLILFVVLTSIPLLAQETPANGDKSNTYMWAIIIGGGIIAIAASIGTVSQAKAISSAMEGISRNPGAASHIRFLLIFGLVLIETLVIYALLISIIILMVQWGNYA